MSEIIKLSDEQEEELLKFINKRHKLMRDKRQAMDTKIARWLDLYNSVAEDKDYDWESNLFVPYVYSIIQAMIPRMRAALFGANQIISVEAMVEAFVQSEIKIAAYGEQKLKQMKWRKKARDIISAAFKYPYAPVYTRWRFEVDSYVVKEYPKIFGVPVKFMPPRDVEKTSIVYDDPDIELIQWDNFWVDPDATSMEDARDCIHRMIKDYNYLKAREKDGYYYNIEKLKGEKPPQDIDLFVRDKLDSEGYYDQADKGYNETEIKMWYGPYDLYKNGELEEIIVSVGNGKQIIRVVKNDNYKRKKPFTLVQAMPEENTIYGKCVPEILESLQNELNDLRNARMDNIKLLLRKRYRVLQDAKIDLNQFFGGPGNAIFLENMDDVQEEKVENIVHAVSGEEENIKNDMQQTARTTDYNMGTSGGRGINSTATGISIITSESASGHKDIADSLREGFVEIIDTVFMLLKQYKSEDEVLRLYEKGESRFEKISVEELQADYYLDLNLKSLSVNSQLEQQIYTNLLNILGRFPGINVRALIRMVLEKFDVKNIGEIMNAQAGRQEMEAQGLLQQAGVPGQEVPDEEKTPEQRIAEAGTLNSPVDPTLDTPVKNIPELEQLKALQGMVA